MQVAFYKGRTRIFNRLVSWWLNGPYSHTELVLTTDAMGVSTCASASFMDRGVRPKVMVLNPEHWDLLPVAGDPLHAWLWLHDHEGEGYDLWALLGFFWRRTPASTSRRICSEAVAAMLGWPQPWRFDPMTLWAAVSAQAAKPIH